MATIKAIDTSTIHRIQSGQVIVDICSVAKELIENSVDAGATSLDIRFKNQGLDSIEVQDNGSGISPENYAGVGLKHHTSKLSTYEDISNLQTFGFRGEAVSSLCALSNVSVITCRAEDVPKGSKLKFDSHGVLKETSVVAAQKGTTVTVENLFYNLPVRRKELERNIKREWNKLIALLNQYACIQTNLKFTVSQQPTKGKKIILFSTKGNPKTRDNIINVFGAKTMQALVPLDLLLEMKPTVSSIITGASQGKVTNQVHLVGHVSKPVNGEGRQTPDRQMFYVNGRPCGLPQFAKVFNEVYRSFNSSQSPFIMADIQMDTHMYDVNVSPDKRTILLHDQGHMLDKLKEALAELFGSQDYTVPVAQLWSGKKTPGNSFRSESSETPSKSSLLIGKSSASKSTFRGSVSGLDASTETPNRRQSSLRQKATNQSGDDEEVDYEPNETGKAPTIASALAYFAANATPKSSGTTNVGSSTSTVSYKENTSPIQPAKIVSAADVLRAQEEEGSVEDVDERRVRSVRAPGVAHRANSRQNDEEEEVEEDEDDDDDSLFVRQPKIPDAVDTTSSPVHDIGKRFQAGSSQSTNTIRAYHTPPDVATISIGDTTVVRSIGRSASKDTNHSGVTTKGISSSGRLTNTRNAATGKPGFGSRLAEMFSAHSAKAKKRDQEKDEEEDEDSQEDEEQDLEEDVEESEDESVPEQRKHYPRGQPTDEVDDDDGNHQQGSKANKLATLEIRQAQLPTYKMPSRASGRKRAAESDSGSGDDTINESAQAAKDQNPTVSESVTNDTEEISDTEATPKRNPSGIPSVGTISGPGTTTVNKPSKREATVNLVQTIKTDESDIEAHLSALQSALSTVNSRVVAEPTESKNATLDVDDVSATDPETKLTLTITKEDFGHMKIVGQFNLGFIIAVRPAFVEGDADAMDIDSPNEPDKARQDELLIIDQHATDEKYNFERLQATTIVQSQRLVNPKQLELTALEEEIVIENKAALEANGFDVSVDLSGDVPVGSRCHLLALPLSRETTFTLSDLEELISLLGDHQTSLSTADTALSSFSTTSASFGEAARKLTAIPRPSRVRKMFAMRACRSSVMIGSALTHGKMETLVRHMGELDKPWNCPHGRPTMRHLSSLGSWEEKSWREEELEKGILMDYLRD